MTLNLTLFVAATIVFIIISILLIQSLTRAYRNPPDHSETSDQLRPNVILETAWTIVPLGILVVLLVLTFQAI